MRYSPGRLDLTLIALVMLAFATMALARSGWALLLVNGAVLALAAIKGRMILLDYLGLRSAPPLWRGLATAWLLLVAGLAWAVSAASAVFS
jgi:hypothetical protein